MLKLGLIGCGGMGSHHARVFGKMPNVSVAGVCDIVEEKARKVGQDLDTKWCVDYRDLLGDVDAVWVCTEPFNRLEIVTTSAKAGKHVFAEKPICLSLEDADQMIAAAEDANVKFMLGYVLRFRNPYKLMHDTFVSGELGELVTCWTRRFMPADMSNRWYGWQGKSLGVTLDFGSHDIDWLRWIGGDVQTIFAKTFRVRPTIHADEHGQALMLFKSGGMGTCDVSWSSYLTESSVGIVGTKGAMIVGRDGKVRKKVGDGEEQILDVDSVVSVDPEGNLARAANGGQGEINRQETIQEHFIRCVEEDLEPLTAARDGRKTLATILALQESARSGQAVDVASAER
jgi:predicted dehydrogenase